MKTLSEIKIFDFIPLSEMMSIPDLLMWEFPPSPPPPSPASLRQEQVYAAEVSSHDVPAVIG